MKYQYTPIRKAEIINKKTNDNKCWSLHEKWNLLCIVSLVTYFAHNVIVNKTLYFIIYINYINNNYIVLHNYINYINKNMYSHFAKLFPLCSKTKHNIFTIGYICNRNTYTGAQKTYTVLLCYSKNVNLFQCNWSIREQYEQSTNFTLAYAQSNLWETLGKDRKLNPDGKRHTGIHKMYIFQALVWVLWVTLVV